MTAQLTLGGLLDDKRRDAIHQLLGAPDCAAKAGEDAWQLGFASTQMDPDCLHVWYDNSQRSVRAQVLQQ
ncbi:MAG: hypothetical protein JWN04_717 [Myxococcaceae bacterium]|nr:hypothetical protein [Myxococcaceae bacterium]